MGIAYAAPDMRGGNFWGVINHDNEEGIIRIADNRVTRGLKMWTWGFPSFTERNRPAQGPEPAAALCRIVGGGVGRVFPQRRDFPRWAKCRLPETYSPTVGMSNVTHANENILVNLSAEASSVNLQFFSIEPATPLRVTLKRGDAVLFDEAVTSRPEKRQSHFRGDSCRQQRRTGAADDQDRGRQGADRRRDKVK